MLSLITRLFDSRPTTTRRSNRTILGVDSLDVRVTPAVTKPSIDYIIELSPEQERELHIKHMIKIIHKKNVLTIKNLSPGNYTVSNDVHIVAHKVLAKTKHEPTTSFQLIDLN